MIAIGLYTASNRLCRNRVGWLTAHPLITGVSEYDVIVVSMRSTKYTDRIENIGITNPQVRSSGLGDSRQKEYGRSKFDENGEKGLFTVSFHLISDLDRIAGRDTKILSETNVLSM
jgi:hypothetical protein